MNLEELKKNWLQDDSLTVEQIDKINKCIESRTSPNPEKDNVFNAFEDLNPEKVRVLIVGQDPYPEIGRADGMAFSFGNGDSPKDSLGNIFARLEEIGIKNKCTNLNKWKKQGVLLLNTALTYKENESHFEAWEPFVSAVINKLINEKPKNKPLVVMLFGEKANLFNNFKDDDKDEEMKKRGIFIIRTSHPCNMSKNYIGNYSSKLKNNVRAFTDKKYNPFKKCNEFLKANGAEIINWQT